MLGAISILAVLMTHYQGTTIPKQFTHFYASKESKQLIEEPAEWPVKLVYHYSWLGSVLPLTAYLFGSLITRQQKIVKNCKDSAIVAQQIAHYLHVYKDFITMEEFIVPSAGFTTFNEWFTRALKNPEKDRPLQDDPTTIVAPADSKLLIIPNLALDTQITIKQEHFDVAAFLGNKELAQCYEGGTLMLFRLSPYNYHHYHYPFDCTVSPEVVIPGAYHSVNRRVFALGINPLLQNKRSYELLKTPYAQLPIVMVQVGALAVASIVNTFMVYDVQQQPIALRYPANTLFKKGHEMGMFQFGGSTLVLLFPPGIIVSNRNIVENSLRGYETAVKVRETVAWWHKGGLLDKSC